MSIVRLALANLPPSPTREASVQATLAAIAEAGSAGAHVVAFPECFVPGYRGPGMDVAPPDAAFLEEAWRAAEGAAAAAKICVVLGTERITEEGVIPAALVIAADGGREGFQDKVQLDPSEDTTYTAGRARRVFRSGPLTFGVVICHEGWRYPETVRWAARQGAEVVFHPHFHWLEAGGHRPARFGEADNSFHERSVLCRAAENTIYFASINYATEGAPTSSAIATPEGDLLAHQPYGKAGLLIADVDLARATGLLAKRYRPIAEP